MPKAATTKGATTRTARTSKPTSTTTSTTSARRQATVYDVVASRVNYAGFIKPRRRAPTHTTRNNTHAHPHSHSHSHSHSREQEYRSAVARPADEVLSRRLRAPADLSQLQDDGAEGGAPDDELLLAVHQYAADFYDAHGMAEVSCRSLDETALIAIGLLLENTIDDLLGAGGHRVLVDKRALEEYHDDDDDDDDDHEEEEEEEEDEEEEEEETT
ncbi:hypothetical protein BZA05DRAFT_65512 [Tricharina praecox]|uniref:uncharacterized protein n=1 Tax=Tricharina praecox TaxID=43433 RepID=UPI0022201EFB|nr:uncharacterized protein BZA05DRAFT_65512 [Tricharina praecox]KAI5849988.1 hypothetical protein BZA05DRAFT_65512 [Tricharina praecox]